MRGKIALIGALAVLLSSTSVNAAGAKAPQDNAGQGTEQPQGTPPAPAKPKVNRTNSFIIGLPAIFAAAAGGALAVDTDPNSP